MNYLHRYTSIVVDPDIETRMILKQAMVSAQNFDRAQHVSSLEDGLAVLSKSERCDVVFVSYKFDQKDLTDFITKSKALPQGQDSAYVLILQGKNQNSAILATNVLVGADGFLFEPYSVESLLDITNLSTRVRSERTAERQRAAIKILVSDLISKIDLLAFLKSNGEAPGPILKELRKKHAMIQSLDDEARKVYFEIMVESFEKAPLPKYQSSEALYSGKSKRVKKRLAKRLGK